MIALPATFGFELPGMAEPSPVKWTISRIARQGEAQRSQMPKEFVEKGLEVYAKT